MCPTTRGSRPDEPIIELMDVVEEGVAPLRPEDGDAEALLLEEVVEEGNSGEDVLELTDILDDDALELTDILDDQVDAAIDELISPASAEETSTAGREFDEEEIDLTELDDLLRDIEDEDGQAGDQKLDGLSVGAAGEEDLADIDSLLRELEEDGGNAEADLIPAGLEAADAEDEPDAAVVKYILSGLDAQAATEPPSELRTMKRAVEAEKLSDEALDRMGEADALAHMDQMDQMDQADQADQADKLGELGKDMKLDQLLAEDEPIAQDLQDLQDLQESAPLTDEGMPAGEDMLEMEAVAQTPETPETPEASEAVETPEVPEVPEVAEAVEAGPGRIDAGEPPVELPSEIPNFNKSPIPVIPVGLPSWDAEAAERRAQATLPEVEPIQIEFAQTDSSQTDSGEVEPAQSQISAQIFAQTSAQTPAEKPAEKPMDATPMDAEPSALAQRLTWRLEALEILVKDELVKARGQADRLADMETFVLGAPKPEEWTELMEAVSALRAAQTMKPSEPVPSVDPQEVADLRERLENLETQGAALEAAVETVRDKAPAVPEGLDGRLAALEERAGGVSLEDFEALREAIWKLERRLDEAPAPDKGMQELAQRLEALEALGARPSSPAGLDEDALVRLAELDRLARRLGAVEAGLQNRPTLNDMAAHSERLKAVLAESVPVQAAPDHAVLDDLRVQLTELRSGYETLAPAAALVSSVTGLDERLKFLESAAASEPEVSGVDLQKLTSRLDELESSQAARAFALAGLEERLKSLESLDDAAVDHASRLSALAERQEGLEGRLVSSQTEQAERFSELDKRVEERMQALESRLAALPPAASVSELVEDIRERAEEKVFDRVEIVLSGRMIDQIERLEESLPGQIKEIVAKQPASIDEAALASRLMEGLEARLADRLETALVERVESTLAERFGVDLREKLEEFLEEAVMGTLRTELLEEIRRDMPQAAAKVIREEIEALKRAR